MITITYTARTGIIDVARVDTVAQLFFEAQLFNPLSDNVKRTDIWTADGYIAQSTLLNQFETGTIMVPMIHDGVYNSGVDTYSRERNWKEFYQAANDGQIFEIDATAIDGVGEIFEAKLMGSVNRVERIKTCNRYRTRFQFRKVIP